MINKHGIIISLIVVAAVFTPLPVNAHFIIQDQSTDVKASFHVTPDHDPVAGESSVISYDFSKGDTKTKDYTYSLTVGGTKSKLQTVPTELAGNVVLANYTFPARGLYTITLTANPLTGSAQPSTLQYSQRVSRGVSTKEHGLGKLEVAIIAGTLLVAAAAVVLTFKKDIPKSNNKQGIL